MDYRSQFPLWFFLGILLAGGVAALITALRAALAGLGEGWGVSLLENAPAAVLSLAALLITGLVVRWRLSR
jgi:hypothetical protein